MTPLRMVLDGNDLLPELQGKKIHKVMVDAVAAFPGGTVSGKPSVALVIHMEDGSVVFAETTLALFTMASRAFIARYGDPQAEG